jgi:hypothetical protein
VTNGEAYRIHASASAKSLFTSSGYCVKSCKTTLFSFVTPMLFELLLLGPVASAEASIGRRVSAMREVILGLRRHWRRTSVPTRPVEPARMSFISAVWCGGGYVEGRWEVGMDSMVVVRTGFGFRNWGLGVPARVRWGLPCLHGNSDKLTEYLRTSYLGCGQVWRSVDTFGAMTDARD